MAMTLLYSVYVLTLALLIYMIFLLVRMSGSKAAAAFLCVVFSEIFIVFGMMLEIMMDDNIGVALVCLKLQYVGQAVFLMSLLYFFSIFMHIKIPPAVYVVQGIVNLIMLVGCITAEHHTLFYSSMRVVYDEAPYPTLKVTDGPIWYMHYAHLFIVQFAIIFLAVKQYRKGNARQKARCRYLLLGLGSETFELILKGAGLFGSFNPFVIAAFVFSVCLYVGIIRYGYFDTVEVAMRNVLNISEEGFIVVDTDENIVYMNAPMKRMFPELYVGAPVRCSKLAAEIFNGEQEVSQDGVYYKAILDEVREGDLVGGKMLRLIDMTDYLKQVERLRKENENKTDFLSRVSHEIRTPLNTINGMNEMILRESHEPQTLAYAEDIHEAEETLMSLIGDVLDVTRIEQTALELEPVEFSLKKLLRKLWRATELKCQRKGLELTFDIDPTLPAVWYADEARTYQIAENLLSNAVKYTETGSVALTLRRSEKDKITLAVKDTGIGIPKGSEDKIFRRFEQLQTSNRRQGLGLGLEITKSIVDLMGGRISVASEVGKGSRFAVTLPMTFVNENERIGTDWQSADKTETAGMTRTTFRCEGKRILVVDDNEMNRRVMHNYLKDSGLQIDEAANGEACLALLAQSNPYDLLLLDHMMPGMDGIELFHRITALPSYQANPVPAIALTANAIKGAKWLYLAEGFDDYLSKPIDMQTLFDTLYEYLGGDLSDAPRRAEEEPVLPDTALAQLAAAGMELDIALHYAEGSQSFLCEELMLFLKNEPQTTQAMEVDAQKADWDALAVLVHGLKNNLATLGFAALAAEAKALELALRENGDAAGYASFVKKYHQLTAALRLALDERYSGEEGGPQ